MAVITSLVTGAGLELRQLIASSRQSGSVRACLLTTRDREHAMNIVKETVCFNEHPLYHFTVAGRRRLDPNTLTWVTVGDCSEPTSLLTNARELKGGAVVVFEDYLHLLSDENGDRRVRMVLNQMLSSETVHHGLVLVFIEPPEAWPISALKPPEVTLNSVSASTEGVLICVHVTPLLSNWPAVVTDVPSSVMP